MTHRERIIAALEHRTPDRCPMQVSFTPEFARRLRADLKLKGQKIHNPHGGGNTYALERALGEDMLLTSVGWANSYYMDNKSYTDEWGVGWKVIGYQTPFGSGQYTEISGHPLADPRALGNYRAPDPDRPELYREAQRAIKKFAAEYWIVGVTVTTIFECAWALRGLEQLLLDMVCEPDLADAVLDIPFRYHLRAARNLAELGVDMIWIGDDIGGQTSMIFSPELWRRFLKPRMAEFIRTLKAIRPRIKIAYHSDGNILPVIPELIEIGVDVLNPVQPACMNPEELKNKYGDRLCFWGSIDEQHTLPFGTSDEVSREVLQRIATLGRDGGLIIGPTHHVQLDTPMENFWAMIRTVTGMNDPDGIDRKENR